MLSKAACVLSSCLVFSLTLLQTGNQAEDKARPIWSLLINSGVPEEQWLSVSICIHFLLKVLCDDSSSKIEDTASRPIRGTGYIYLTTYFMSLLQPVQKHFACPTLWTKFYLLVFKSHEFFENNVASESSYTPSGHKQE